MTLDTESKTTNGADKGDRSGVWSRVEGARDVLRDQTRQVTEIAGRQLSGAQRRVVGTVRAKPVTSTATLAGLALLGAGVVFALRNPKLVKKVVERVRSLR